jgi:beta-xylosidase
MDYTFSYSKNGKDWKVLKKNFDIGSKEYLSGGRYTGPMIGMYASSNGQPSKSIVDFDYFYYQGDK